MQKLIKQRLGFTLVELLLVCVVMLTLTSAVYPLVPSLSLSGLNDLPAINLLKDALAHANSMGLIARDKESQLSFKTGNPSFYRSDKQVGLPDGYKIGKIFLLAGGSKKEVATASIKFMLSGQIMANAISTDRIEIEVKRGNNLVDSVEARSRFFDVAWQSGSSNWSADWDLPDWADRFKDFLEGFWF